MTISLSLPRTGAFAFSSFRRYFCAGCISQPGIWVQITAQAWVVLELYESPMALATVTTLQFMPIFLFTLMGGALADRMARGRLLLIVQIAGGLQSLTLGLLVLSGVAELWMLCLLAITLGFVNALDGPLRQAIVGDLVPKEALANGVALAAITQNLGRLAGPALAGGVIAWAGPGYAFLITSSCYTISAMLLSTLKIAPNATVQPAAKMGLLRATREGLDFAFQSAPIRFVLVVTAFIGTFGQNFTTMVPLVAQFLLQAAPAEFGLLNSALGAGSIAGVLVLTRLGNPTPQRLLLAGAGFGGLLVVVSQSSVLALSCGLFVMIGFASVIFATSVQTALQLLAPPEMRGRLAAMVTFLIVGTSPIGAIFTGTVAELISVSATIWVNGAMCLVGVFIALRIMSRSKMTF